ncbi:MAG: phosphoglycolate phosphatase [Albidovulum sp.]
MTVPPALVFDLDGTLIDSLPDLHAAVNRLLAAESEGQMSLGEVASYVGDGARVLVSRVMAARDMDQTRHPELTERFINDYTQHSADLTCVYPGVHAALTALKEAGHVLGLCTNKPKSATLSVLEQLRLGQYFDTIIAGDSMAERKPHPAPLLAAFEALNRRGTFIGDSEVDARTAEAAGVPFFLYTLGYLRVPISEIRVSASFNHFGELEALMHRSTSV